MFEGLGMLWDVSGALELFLPNAVLVDSYVCPSVNGSLRKGCTSWPLSVAVEIKYS